MPGLVSCCLDRLVARDRRRLVAAVPDRSRPRRPRATASPAPRLPAPRRRTSAAPCSSRDFAQRGEADGAATSARRRPWPRRPAFRRPGCRPAGSAGRIDGRRKARIVGQAQILAEPDDCRARHQAAAICPAAKLCSFILPRIWMRAVAAEQPGDGRVAHVEPAGIGAEGRQDQPPRHRRRSSARRTCAAAPARPALGWKWPEISPATWPGSRAGGGRPAGPSVELGQAAPPNAAGGAGS